RSLRTGGSLAVASSTSATQLLSPARSANLNRADFYGLKLMEALLRLERLIRIDMSRQGTVDRAVMQHTLPSLPIYITQKSLFVRSRNCELADVQPKR